MIKEEAGAAIDAVETVIWRYEHGEEITRSMLKDARSGIAALRLVQEKLPDLMAL